MKFTNIASLLAFLGTQTYARPFSRSESNALTTPQADSPGEFPYGGRRLPFEAMVSKSNYIPSSFDNVFSRWWFGLESKSKHEKQLKDSEQVVTDFIDRVVGYQPMANMFHANEANQLLFRIPGNTSDYIDPFTFNYTMQTLRDELPRGINATNQASTLSSKGLFQIQLVNDSVPFDPTNELKVRFALSPSKMAPEPYKLLDTEATREPRVARFLMNRPQIPLPFTGQDVMNELSKLLFYKKPNGTDVDDLFHFDDSFNGQILQNILYHANDTTTGSSIIHTVRPANETCLYGGVVA